MSRLESCVAISSTKTEYVTIAQVGKKMICMTNYLKESGKKKSEKILYTIVRMSYHLWKT